MVIQSVIILHFICSSYYFMILLSWLLIGDGGVVGPYLYVISSCLGWLTGRCGIPKKLLGLRSAPYDAQ